MRPGHSAVPLSSRPPIGPKPGLMAAAPTPLPPPAAVIHAPPNPPGLPCSELLTRGLEASFLEEEVEAASQGKGSVALGEAADNLEADLVVLATAGEGDRGGK